jgi:hypothetical protein
MSDGTCEKSDDASDDDASGDVFADIGELFLMPATKALFQDLQKKVQSIGDGQGKPTIEYVTLPFLRSKTSNFLFNGTSPLLFIRSQYITLYDEITKTSKVSKNIFLDGNSGVGKSFFIYYFMYRLHKDKLTFRGYNCGERGGANSLLPVVSSTFELGQENCVFYLASVVLRRHVCRGIVSSAHQATP